MSKGQPPAVVVGAAGPCGLGMARSLGRAGVSVTLLDTHLFAPAMHTRFAERRVITALSGPGLVDDLLALDTVRDGPAVLFLTTDEAVLTVSEHRARLEGKYKFRLPSHDRLSSLMHKASFQQLAEAHGFPIPRSIRIERSSDLSRLLELMFPCIIKPTIKNAEYFRSRLERAYRVASIEQAEAVCRRMLPIVPDLIAQEWIEGADDEIYFCLQYRALDGTTVCSFTGRKLSIWPPDVGVTASCTAAPDAEPILRRLTEDFFDRTSFVGMGSIEFKKDIRRGQFLMIEPTVGRADWQEEVATLHGANIPLAAYLHEVGQNAPRPEPITIPVIWQDTGAHWHSARRNRTAGTARPSAAIYDAYWRFDDPVPALIDAMVRAMRILRRSTNWLPFGSDKLRRKRGRLPISG